MSKDFGVTRNRLRVGVLGAGYMGGKLARLVAANDSATVAAVCARPLSQARDLCASLGGAPAAFDEFGRMLEETPMDALIIAIPPHAHEGQFEAAAARGIPVFIEKPIALTVARGRSMAQAAESSRVPTQVGYHMRFLRSVRHLRALLDSGEAGRPTLFQGCWLCHSEHSPWWRDVTRSGGQILEQAIHLYDLALHLVGFDPVFACGCLRNLQHRHVPGYTVEDTSAAIIQFGSGALASICASNAAVPGEWTPSFSLVCERLTVHFRSGRPTEFIHTAGGGVVHECLIDDNDPYAEELDHFLAAIRGAVPAASPVSEGLLGLEVVTAVIESSRQNGSPVALATG